MLLNWIFRFFEIPRVLKRVTAVLIDSIFIVSAVVCAIFLRDELQPWLSKELYFSVGLTLVFTVLLWIKLGLYRAVIRFIDTKALSTIFLGAVLSGVIMILATHVTKAPIPRSIPFIYTMLLMIFIGGSRLVVRGLINTRQVKEKVPVIIYGAGASGCQLALALKHGAEYNPVALIDDNLELKNTNVAGLKVYSRDDMEGIISKYNVSKILLAIPSASAKCRKNLLNQLEKFAVEVLTIPGSADLVSGKLRADTLRRVDVIDLLGREPVKPIDKLVKKCIENKNVMVTGAGGSIGSELCRQIVTQSPVNLFLFESSEHALYSIEKELSSIVKGKDINLVPILGSVLDRTLLEYVMKYFGIQTVYHAAAYKHVPLVEYNVVGGLRNNVWGTKICAEASLKCGVEDFVLISSDKAVRPTNIMGATKRLSECVLQSLSRDNCKTRFTMVRFGNVLGSSGSVVPVFEKQIAEGGPLTITHPDITRYFMTIPEAAQLVIQAGSMGKGGEVYVLDMGKPVKIMGLAQKMVHLSGLSIKDDDNVNGDIEIVHTGLRPGEKLFEELLIGKDAEGTEHKRVMKAKEISMSPKDLEVLLSRLELSMTNYNISEIRELLIGAPLGFSPSSEIADVLSLKMDLAASSSNANSHLKVL